MYSRLITRIVASTFNVHEHSIHDGTKLIDDLGMDGDSQCELLDNLNDEFDSTVNRFDLKHVNTVKQLREVFNTLVWNVPKT